MANGVNLSDEYIKVPQILADLINKSNGEPSYSTFAVCVKIEPCGSSMGGCQTDCQNSPCMSQGCAQSCSESCSESCNEDMPPCHWEGVCPSESPDPCLETCQESCYEGCGQSTITKPTETGTLTVTGTTQTTISVSFTSITNADRYCVACREENETVPDEDYNITGLTWTLSGKKPNTVYLVNYRGGNSEGYGPYMATAVRAKTKPEINAWEWYTNIYSGASMNVNNKDILVIPPTEWNDFCDFINNVRELHKLSVYNFTHAIEGNSATATQFNEAVSAIQSMSSTVASLRVSTGTQIMAQSFLDIRDEINSCIP